MNGTHREGDRVTTERWPLRLAIVGCGAVARLCHLPAVSSIADGQLTALVDTSLQRAASLREAYQGGAAPGGVAIAESVDEVLSAFDAALICTSHASHHDLACQLLLAGKHVLIEKPLAPTVRECDEIAQLAGQMGLVAAVGHVRRLFPAVPWVKRLLREGSLGEIRQVTWKEGFEFRWPSASLSMFKRDESGGGVTLEAGAHVLDLLLSWFGPQAEVVGYCDDGPRGVESEAQLRLKFGAVDAMVELSRLRRLANTCVIEGSEASVTFDIDLEAKFEISSSEGIVVNSGAVPVLDSASSGWDTLFADQISHFIAAANGFPAHIVAAEEARLTVGLANACYSHARRDILAQPWKTAGHSGGFAECASGRSFAITGASGFVGSRLAEELVTRHHAAVRAVVREPGRLAKLAALDQERLRFAVADVNDFESLAESFAGVDVVVHCAHGSDGNEEDRWRTTVEGTRNALKAASQVGVRRFVHISTISVYDREHTGDQVSESSPLVAVREGDLGYTQQKLAAQHLVSDTLAADDDMEIVIVQPTVIYGPWSPSWTVEPLNRLRTLSESLPQGNEGGACNAVYIDDVVAALVLAAAVPQAAGQSFLISGPKPESWGRFYDKYRELIRPESLVASGESVADWERDYYLSSSPVSIQKARGLLGYRPSVSFDEGMHRVGQWARWAGLVD